MANGNGNGSKPKPKRTDIPVLTQAQRDYARNTFRQMIPKDKKTGLDGAPNTNPSRGTLKKGRIATEKLSKPGKSGNSRKMMDDGVIRKITPNGKKKTKAKKKVVLA